MSKQLAQPSAIDFTYSLIQRLLQEARYDQAIEMLSERIADQPQDRMAVLLLLLANISRYGSDAFEEPIEELRYITDLSINERHIVRRIFLACFQQAERDGRTLQKIVYQRLIRRLLLNQPLDLSISEARALEGNDKLAAIAPADIAPAPATAAATPAAAIASPLQPSEQRSPLALAATGAMILLLLGFYLFTGSKPAERDPEPVRARVGTESMALAAANHPLPPEPPAAQAASTEVEKAAPLLKPHTRYRLEVAREARGDKTAQATPEPQHVTSAKGEAMEASLQSGIESEIARASMLKQEPRFAADAIEKVDPGTRVIVLAKERDWLKVQVQPSGNIGYLRKEYLSPPTTQK